MVNYITDILRIGVVGLNRKRWEKVYKSWNTSNFNSLKGGNEIVGYILLVYNITGYPDLVITYNSWLKVTGMQLAQSTA